MHICNITVYLFLVLCEAHCNNIEFAHPLLMFGGQRDLQPHNM